MMTECSHFNACCVNTVNSFQFPLCHLENACTCVYRGNKENIFIWRISIDMLDAGNSTWLNLTLKLLLTT